MTNRAFASILSSISTGAARASRRAGLLLGAAGLAAAVACAASAPALAQGAWPSQNIRIMLGYAAGGGADTISRYYANKLQEVSGQTVVVINRPGAGGNIGANQAANAKPDGYTLLIAPNIAFLGNIHAYKDPTYHPIRDFEPITTLAILPFIYAVGPKSPINSIPDLVAHIKARDGKATYGGTTTTAILAAELLLGHIKGKATRVPYKSMGDSVADLDGSLDFVIADGTFAVGQARGGRMKLLAVTTLERSGVTPDLPTMDELGYKGYDIPASFGAYAPKATPKEIVAKLEGWLNEIVRRPETKTFLYNLATDPYPGDQALLRKIMVEETKKWGEMMESAGVEKQ